MATTIQNFLALKASTMVPLFCIRISYLFSLLSLDLVFCNLYSDSLVSETKRCDARDHACNFKTRLLDPEDDGPTLVGRSGLTRLDGIKVSINSSTCNFS